MLLERAKSPLKRCTLCAVEKPRDAFNRSAKRVDGLSHWCRECQGVKRAAHYSANREHEAAQIRAYYQEHAEELRAKRRARGYRDSDRATRCRYVEKNGERIRAKRLTPEAKAAQRERNRAWRAANPEKSRENCRRQQAVRWFSAKANPVSYDAVFERYAGMCYLCLEPVDRRTAHFDHVIPLSKGGSHFFENIRPTHPACNLRKGCRIVMPGAFAVAH